MPTTQRVSIYECARQRTRAYLEVLIKVAQRLRLDLDALQALALQLRRRLDRVHHLVLDEREQRAGANARVRPERHEHVREAVDRDREVRDRVRLPPIVDVDSAAPDDLER